MGNSAQLSQSSPKNGPLPDASSIKCDGFLVSTYSKLCYVTWRTTILLYTLPGWATITVATVVRMWATICKKRRHCKWRLTHKRRTKKLDNRHTQTASRWPIRYKGMQRSESRAFLWLYRFHTPQCSCATAPGEEELEEENDALAHFRVKERVLLSSV